MTQVYNKASMLDRRRELRQHATRSEEVIWSHVRREQRVGTKIKRQYSVHGFVIDFYAPSVKLAIELDGSSHDKEFAAGRDAIRQKMIEEYGIHFLRFRDEEIYSDIERVLHTIDSTIEMLKKTSPLTPHLS
jgi:very-short-patch-repair endonuclease